ncbi:MAG: hypothetical protein AB8B83_02900 [Bdellovibrionales bacterium]
MQNLFNNQSYPLVSSKEEAIAALRADVTKATAIRAPDWTQQVEQIQSGITITDDPELAARYNKPKDDPERKMTGEKGYLVPFTADDIRREAQNNGISIDENTLSLFTKHLAEVREKFLEIQTELLGHDQFETVGRLLFAPIGAEGRAPVMHVDNYFLTLHETFKGALLRVHSEKGMAFNETIWNMLDRQKTSKKSIETDQSQTQLLIAATTDFNDEFANTTTGDVLIMHGQQGKNLSDPAERQKVCVHSSSQMIRVQGQVAVSYFTRPLPETYL